MSLEVRPRASAVRANVDTVVFDMDGVLIDISESIRRVNCLAPEFYLRDVLHLPVGCDLLSSETIELYKHAGGFNDDWDLTFAIVLAYLTAVQSASAAEMAAAAAFTDHAEITMRIAERGGGLQAAESILWERCGSNPGEVRALYNKVAIRQVFEEMFAGDLCERIYHHACNTYHGRGYVYNDRCLIDTGKIPSGLKLGMQTGRTYEEAEVGRELCGMVDLLPDPVCITKRDGFHKPDPGGLAALAQRLGTQTGGIYIGDTLDDLRTVSNLNALAVAPPFLIALVLTGPAGAANLNVFRDNGADIIAGNVNEVLEWLIKDA